MLAHVVCVALFLAQAPARPRVFEAASIKPAQPELADGRAVVGMLPPTGGPGTTDPGRIRYPLVSLGALVRAAYDLAGPEQIVGPAWLDTAFFQVDTLMPPDTTKEQFREMLTNLLADRFKLKAHRAAKGAQVWALGLARNGPRMKRSTDQQIDAPLPAGALIPPPEQSAARLGADGFPARANVPVSGAGIFTTIGTLGIRLTARQQTMHDLATALSRLSRRPVLDETGLTAKYDFVLTFTTSPDVDALPNIFTAVQLLGLRLQSKAGSAGLLVIDTVEKTPTAN